MISIGHYGLVLAVPAQDVPPWLRPVVDAGRNAAFVDTGYIRALLDERDERHATVRRFHEGLSASLYTSALVVAEAVRQFAKADQVSQDWRWARVESLTAIFARDYGITVCAPPDNVIGAALDELTEMQRFLVRLDLCDLVSMLVLDLLSHRRVLGFDDHFRSIGASLEP